MADASLILDAIVAVSIAAGAFFAVWELRGISRSRRTELVIHLSHYVDNPESMETYVKILRADIKNGADVERVCSVGEVVGMANFFETLGFLVRNRDVDANAVRDLMGPMAANLWDKIRPFIDERREDFSPEVLHNFEWLVNDVKRSRGTIGAAQL